MSQSGSYHVFEARPGELGRSVLKDLHGAIPAAECAARLIFERWDPVRGYVSDAFLTNLELDRQGGGQ